MKKTLLPILLMAAAQAGAQSTPDAIKLGDVDFTATLRSRVTLGTGSNPLGHSRTNMHIQETCSD